MATITDNQIIKVHGNKGIDFEKKCLSCQRIFFVTFSHLDSKYCSQKCYGESKKGKLPWNKNRPWTETERKILSDAHIGIKMPPRTIEHRENMALARKGEKSHLYKGGIAPINKDIRAGIEFRLWREAVFARDNFTDQKTGIQGGNLHPHHILNFSEHPELRFAIDNGITFSKESHTEFHKIYGFKNNTLEQLNEFLNKNITNDNN